MERIVPVTKGDVTYAILFLGQPSAQEGVRFMTKPTDEFQLGVMERPAGYQVKPHTHPRTERRIQGMNEFLYLEKGSMIVTIFDDEWKVLHTEKLVQGDFLLFFRGGHGIEMIEDCRLLEVKQGPYIGQAMVKYYLSES